MFNPREKLLDVSTNEEANKKKVDQVITTRTTTFYQLFRFVKGFKF